MNKVFIRSYVTSGFVLLILFTVLTMGLASAHGQLNPPDLGICGEGGVECENVSAPICSDAGFQIKLVSVIPANFNNSGSATYNYEICSPPAGVCEGGTGLRVGESCLDDGFCQTKGRDTDPEASCNRECAVDKFYSLSHLDILFPELGGAESCLSADTTVSGTCGCKAGSSVNCEVNANVILGDASCFNSTSGSFVAKCDNTTLEPGDCVEMNLTIAGELTELGIGSAIVVDKEARDCTASCMAGPSCDQKCDETVDELDACLTRTIGFWGTHPWITNDYSVTVCGKTLGCSGPDDGKSDLSCQAYSCDSVMEGLGSLPSELSTNQPYVSMIKQLTAAKLNLNATGELAAGECSDFVYKGKTIQEWINDCEDMCNANKTVITNSGCIEALNAFNNSEDTGFDVTPSPFDRPPVDDHSNISGGDSSNFTKAQGNKKNEILVIGKKVGNYDCR